VQRPGSAWASGLAWVAGGKLLLLLLLLLPLLLAGWRRPGWRS
jgi:hypothetical protein